MFYYCNRDKEKLNKHLGNIRKYRESFAEIDEIINIIHRKVTENNFFCNN